MNNFTYHNPVQIVFGKRQISRLNLLVPLHDRIAIIYGGGSIMKNGVYNQVKEALQGFSVVEFGGIEANPDHETCIKAMHFVRSKHVKFLLAVGGGSVLDAVKYISLAAHYHGNPWDILTKGAQICKKAIPLGCVLTLPATGSEMNSNSVISRRETGEKLAFSSPLVYPKFSILDPETTFSLDARQTANGIIDAMVHVFEQYLTADVSAPLQARQAEAILSTLIDEGPKALKDPANYDVRATIMWSATQALNGLIGVGCRQDWASHGIGHELTAAFGMDHGQTLAVVAPRVLAYSKETKLQKLVQYARRVWNVKEMEENKMAEEALQRTEDFFRSLGVRTRLSEYHVDKSQLKTVAEKACRKGPLGEARLNREDVLKILEMAY
jgi:NADP-dependent alcohol dehydrogenase